MKYWIFGAGKFGRQCYEIFSNKLDIIGFIDNNKEKNGISYCGKIVLFYSEFLKPLTYLCKVRSNHYGSTYLNFHL